MKYLTEILENQHIYDKMNQHAFVESVVHVIELDGGVQWGCVYPPRHHTLWIGKKKPVHVQVGGQSYMSVYRVGDDATWMKIQGTDEMYMRALLTLGINTQEFLFTRENRKRHLSEHVNPIPKSPDYEPLNPEIFLPKLTPNLMLRGMCDSYDDAGNPAFDNQERMEYAIGCVKKAFPSAPIVHGRATLNRFYAIAYDVPAKKRRKKVKS